MPLSESAHALVAFLISLTDVVDLPDLTVREVTASIAGDFQELFVEGTIEVGVGNIGLLSSAVPCGLVVFEDTDRNGDLGQTDRVFGVTQVPPLAPGETLVASVAIADYVRFRDDLIFAKVDSDEEVQEADEDNNRRHSGQNCLIDPFPGDLNPVLEWSWTSSLVQPDALNVMMPPGIIDLTDDGIPDVVFGSTASRGGGFVEVGFLRALNGNDGSEIFTILSPQISTTFSIAVGDIDLDGRPEIIAGATSNAHLIAFEHDGTVKWTSATSQVLNWGAAAIADLDEDGSPEIVFGREVFSAAGIKLWTGTGGSGNAGGVGALSLVADVDLDGSPDVVAGNTVYNANGSIQWMNPSLPDGHQAVGNFDPDEFPEIVLVAGGQVRLLEHTGSVKWGPISIPGGGTGGPPTIADYDADGEREIGVAGATRYVVFETDGTIKWSSTTQDGSSNRTGSSVFDFNGDGAAEVVYGDEIFLRVYRGTDGLILFETPNSSCTWHEYPLVADVDADGNAEIVAVANDNCGFGPQRGVFVYGASDDSWVPTRQTWNQHTYHITNIEDDGSIAAEESNNWLYPAGNPFNNYRQNVLNGLSPLSAPDLTASFLNFDSTSVTGRVGNGGAVVVGTGISISFYDGDPLTGGVSLLGTTQTSGPLKPGDFEDVTFELGVSPPMVVFLSVDDNGMLQGIATECHEDNNIHGASRNQPPECDAGGPYTVECQGAFTSIMLDGSGSMDPDNDELTFCWSTDYPDATFDDKTSPTPELTVPSGPTEIMISLTISDGSSESTCTTSAFIVDTQEPSVEVSCAQELLWPNNHEFRNVGAAIHIEDCDPSATDSSLALIEVWSDEVEVTDGKNGPVGDSSGRHGPDAVLSADGCVDLRSERHGRLDGRVYLIVVQATDSSGNVGYGYCAVVVPMSMSAAHVSSVQAQAQAALGALFAAPGTSPADLGFHRQGLSDPVGPKQDTECQ